ncbi:hypothetical protein MZB64_09610 [Escherichia coli]|nr:hypothetical protein [Escherichia coli]
MKFYSLGILISSLLFSGVSHAIDATERMNDIQQFGKWYYAEFTMPTTMAYRIGVESKLPQDKSTLFIDISPLTQCEPGDVTVNHFIGYKQMDLPPFLPVSYKISGQQKQDSITTPSINEGYVFSPISSLKISDLLKAKGKGSFSFWYTPPDESKEKPQKLFFPLDGLPEAYKAAINSCKENM